MSKLVWYAAIMVAIDVMLYIARVVVMAAQSAKKDDGPSEGSAPQETDATSDSADASAPLRLLESRPSPAVALLGEELVFSFVQSQIRLRVP